MLVYFDESGHPHPNDPASRPVIVAACLQERDARMVAGRLHGLKRDVLGRERMEMKGVRLLNRSTFRRRPDVVAFVEEFFSALLNLPITVFAVIMERPAAAPDPDDTMLPHQFRYLIQRIQLLAESRGEMATLLFDGGAGQLGGLSFKFGAFLYRSEEGRASTNITDTPFFGDSRASAGIQIADMIASVIRQYEEAELYRRMPAADPFLLAVRRYYRIIEQKTLDQTSHDGYARPGLYRMRAEQGFLFADKKEESQL